MAIHPIVELESKQEQTHRRSLARRTLPPRILVVDDEKDIGTMVAMMLRRSLGAEVHVVLNGREAAEKLTHLDFDLIVSDLRMPEMDGLGLFRFVEQNRPSLKRRFQFMSGDDECAATIQASEQSGRPVLQKPFDSSEICEACLEAVSNQ
jgi:CheY-like chemotaxis protein